MRYLVVLLVFVLFSCVDPFCSEQSDRMAGLVVRVLDRPYAATDAQQGEDLGRLGIRISTQEQYKKVFASCCATRLDSIDFTKVEILGLSTISRGIHTSYIRDVQRDDTNKRITYTVTEHYCQSGSPHDGQSNLVVIPKQPSDYETTYVRKQ